MGPPATHFFLFCPTPPPPFFNFNFSLYVGTCDLWVCVLFVFQLGSGK